MCVREMAPRDDDGEGDEDGGVNNLQAWREWTGNVAQKCDLEPRL